VSEQPNSSALTFRKRGIAWGRITPQGQRFYGLDFGPFALGVLLDGIFPTHGYLVRDALLGEAYSARMYRDHPDHSEDAVEAYDWAEREFLRIANGNVDERDLIG